jgi:transcriptional regulator with XRE-family HTH domain
MAFKADFSTIDRTTLHIYAESRKRRVFVGALHWDEIKNNFEFRYDPKYASSKNAIPLGKELDLFKKVHISKGKLFPSLSDRIPSKDNPAYEDYCRSQGISVKEKNPIILLGSIGRRGPSTFIFEPVIKNEFNVQEIKDFRKQLGITIYDMAVAFDMNQLTLQRIESGKKAELGTLRRIQIYLHFPKVALWQLSLTSAKLHSNTFNKIWEYFEILNKKKKSESRAKSSIFPPS